MDSIYVIIALIIIAAAVVLSFKSSTASESRKVHKKNVYNYTAKPLIMTQSEAEFFARLSAVVQERYYVFPQVHLSALLNHRVKGQDWKYAFKHINGKSVDFVLCDKATLRPVYAIELDDYTHERKDRVERDIEVERMLSGAGIPLARFASKTASSDEIIQALSAARSKVTS